MAKEPGPLVIADLRGGRNDVDPPSALLQTQCREALNIDWWRGTLGSKRGGSSALSLTFSAGGPFTSVISGMIRHVPGNDETAAELWAFDSAGVIGRLAASTSWTAPALTDALSTSPQDATGVSLNGMLTICYDTTQNRLHVWDPVLSKVRRAGLATPGAPSPAADGAGGLSWTRVYRVRYVDVSGSDTRRISEASATASVTIGGKLGATVTKPASISEDETHWDLEAADTTAGPWYRIARTVVATTTFDDTNASIPTTTLSASDGINWPPPSAKYVISDDNRLILAGNWETSGGFVTPKSTRVWFTPVLGTTDIGDSERIPTGNYLDVESSITGLGGPLNGIVYVFGYRRISKLVRTGLASAPYQRFTVSTSVGCIAHKTIIPGFDENGSPCLYFLSHRGPYRIGSNGLQYLGSDIETLWSTVNLGGGTIFHGLSYSDKHQIWWFVPTNSGSTPDTKIVFDTKLGRPSPGGAVRFGWAKHTGSQAAATGSVLFSNTPGNTMSVDLKPYIGRSSGTAIWKCDTGTDDAGTAFQAYVDTAEYVPAGYGVNVALGEPFLVAKVSAGVTITVTASPYYGGGVTSSGTASLTADGTETSIDRKIEGLQTAGYPTVTYRIGDAAAVASSFELDALVAPFLVQERR